MLYIDIDNMYMSWVPQQGDKNEEFAMDWWHYPDVSCGRDFHLECHGLLHARGNHAADRWYGAGGDCQKGPGITASQRHKYITTEIDISFAVQQWGCLVIKRYLLVLNCKNEPPHPHTWIPA